VYQVDPNKCTSCDLCRTSCVLSLSAVKAVNDFAKCGYCMLCPAYMDVTSQPDERGVPTGRICPQDALKRRVVGVEDKDDPNNNYYEYAIDEARCDGCGKCVKACLPPAGNGSLRLEIRYDRCVECNECAIQLACPDHAILRLDVPGVAPESHHLGLAK
jgi:electron transport complex protein RnfB